ncbi:mast/stem cell growth factor receptor kita-like isoform X1 [Folsomia candida]|uniref:mast/stem cell growth factor receptor kita-like isoform X1 n=1 Tax=Folsomia candida TaxID=158441 RepID=UPI001604DBE0|nr:mast/stem cell growth factor receptor kita-like isoform X1 [Folsomia candida]
MSKFPLIVFVLSSTNYLSNAEPPNDITSWNRSSESECTKPMESLETPPIVKLVEARFHTNDMLNELEPRCGQSHRYLLPITFQSLRFTCQADYPTFWKFDTPPHNCPILKDFTITKRRTIKSFWDNSTYTFYSNLTLNFKDPYFVPTIFCVRTKIAGSNLSTTIKSFESNDTFKIEVGVTPDYNGIKNFEERRLGENKNCNVTLQLNTDTKKFKCGDNSRPQIIHCNNPDECNSVFVLDDHGDSGRGNVCNNTFSTAVCNSSNKCVQLLPSYSPAVIICRDQANNSIARRYFVYPPKNVSEGPIMRLGRDNEIGPETIRLEANETKIYFGQNVTFTCNGAGAYYSYGFQWGIGRIDSDNFTILDCDVTKESFNMTIHSYQAQTVIQFNKTNDKMLVNDSVKIICFGPRWNKVDWIDASMDVVVNMPEEPTIVSVKDGPYDKSNDSEDYWHMFSCVARGSPIAPLTWFWNSNPLDNHFTGDLYKIIHYSIDNTGITNSTLVAKLPRNIANIVRCVAINFCGSQSYEFEVESITWKWIIIIVGSISIPVLLIILAASFLLIRNHYRKKLQLLSDEEIEEFEQGNSKSETQALSLPYSLDNEVPQEKITILDTAILGEGQFGLVYKGLYNSRLVAIKTMKKTAEVRYIKALLSEIKIFQFVGEHPNLVNMIGACTRNLRTKREIYLLTEFCDNGSLLKFLKQSQGMCLDLFNTNKAVIECKKGVKFMDANVQNDNVNVLPCINTLYLVNWAYDIACAMEYLSSKKIIHGDLASRNVLLTEGLVAKVGDFGLSKQLFEDYAIYVQKLECPLPLKWLAIESLQDFEFSIQSDIWAYGVTLWEIFSLGATPYPGIPQWNFQSYILLKNGYRMEKPTFSNDKIYQVMLACWNSAPNARPSFTKIKQVFQQLATNLKQMY